MSVGFVETNARIAALPGIQNCDYGAKEARAALAIQDAGVSGGGTVLANSNPTIPGTSTSILAADMMRTNVKISNISTDRVFLNFNNAASLTNGRPLNSFQTVTFAGLFAQAEIFAISDAGPSQIAVWTTGV